MNYKIFQIGISFSIILYIYIYIYMYVHMKVNNKKEAISMEKN